MTPSSPKPNSATSDSQHPKQVNKFEFHLLRILRFLLSNQPNDQGFQLIRQSILPPPCLSPTAVALIRDLLAKGLVLFLVRSGGWQSQGFSRNGQPLRGRVWERVPLDERSLSFSSCVVEFLMWFTAEKVHETRISWDVRGEQTPGDELFFWLTFDACRADPDLVTVLRGMDAFQQNYLCWLTFPGEMAGPEGLEPPPFRDVFSGQRGVILECLQSHLASRWLRSERSKGQIGDWKRMRTQGKAEYATLHSFLTAAGANHRFDLGRFVLLANTALFQTELTPLFWTGGLQGSGPPRLADRLETQRAALAVARQMETLAEWHHQARAVGFFDEHYQASQMWKQDWEAADGDRITERASRTLAMLEPLRPNPS